MFIPIVKNDETFAFVNLPIVMWIMGVVFVVVGILWVAFVFLFFAVIFDPIVLLSALGGIIFVVVGLALGFLLGGPSIVIMRKPDRLIRVYRFIGFIPLPPIVRVLDEGCYADLALSISFSNRGGATLMSKLVIRTGTGESISTSFIASNVHFMKVMMANKINDWLGKSSHVVTVSGSSYVMLSYGLGPLISGIVLVFLGIVFLVVFSDPIFPAFLIFLFILMIVGGILLMGVGGLITVVAGIYFFVDTIQKNNAATAAVAGGSATGMYAPLHASDGDGYDADNTGYAVYDEKTASAPPYYDQNQAQFAPTTGGNMQPSSAATYAYNPEPVRF